MSPRRALGDRQQRRPQHEEVAQLEVAKHMLREGCCQTRSLAQASIAGFESIRR
jgi:hypothetical protein